MDGWTDGWIGSVVDESMVDGLVSGQMDRETKKTEFKHLYLKYSN